MRSVSAAADNPDANQKISYVNVLNKDIISIFLLMSIFNIIDKDRLRLRLRPAAVRKTHRFIVRGIAIWNHYVGQGPQE